MSQHPTLTPTLSQGEKEATLTPALSQGERETTLTPTLSQGERDSELPLPLGEGWGEGQCTAFDAAAHDYDSIFTHTTVGRWLREMVWARLGLDFQPGMRVLELACGTGEDAIWLARLGVRVVATDASPAMLTVAREKATRAGVADRVEFRLLDLADLEFVVRMDSLHSPQASVRDPGAEAPTTSEIQFDGAFSNFGGLNCVSDLRQVAEFLGNVVRPGGRVVLVVMGPWCPWEIIWHLAHGQIGTAFRRLKPGGVEASVSGPRVHAWYTSTRRLRQEFAPWFRHRGTFGIGALLPPPYLGHLVDRWPSAFAKVAEGERRVAGWWPFNVWNDHYMIEFERKGNLGELSGTQRNSAELSGTQRNLAEFRESKVPPSSPKFPRVPFLRPLWRRLLAARYRLFQTHRHNRLVLEEVAGRPVLVLPQVFNPKLFRSGELLAQALGPQTIPPGSTVLDMGTGSGVDAVFAAQWAGHVTAVDINPEAVRCARINALLHHVEHKIDVCQGDLFGPVAGESFDVVLFNPPYYRGEPRDALDRAFHANDVMERFVAGLDAVLKPGGRAILVLSSDADPLRVVKIMRQHGFRSTVLYQTELLHETMFIYSFERELHENDLV